MSSTETVTESWAEIRDRLAAAEASDLRRVAAEAKTAEQNIAQVEEQVRNGEDVKPGDIEAAEAAARHARLRLDAVRRKHADLLEQARAEHRRRVHDELAAIATDDDDSVDQAVKEMAAAVSKLAAAVPPWNEELARLHAEAAAVNTRDDADDIVLGTSVLRSNRGRVTVDGIPLAPLSLNALIYGAIHDGVRGDWRLLGEGNLGDQVRGIGHERRPGR